MRQAISRTFLSCVLLGGCGGGADGPADNANMPFAAGMDALEIAALIYANDRRTPVGFYTEPARTPGVNYTTFHLTNTRVDPAAEADPLAAKFELCAGSVPEAAAWEQTDRLNNAPATRLMTSAEDSRLYEYERENDSEPNSREIVRVFKCAFLDRSSVNLRAPDEAAGQVNLQPITADHVRFLAEYLWTFSFYNNAGNAVLASKSVNDAEALIHELTQAELQRSFSSRSCDVLAVFKARYSLAPQTGELTYQEVSLWTQPVRQSPTGAQLCD